MTTGRVWSAFKELRKRVKPCFSGWGKDSQPLLTKDCAILPSPSFPTSNCSSTRGALPVFTPAATPTTTSACGEQWVFKGNSVTSPIRFSTIPGLISAIRKPLAMGSLLTSSIERSIVAASHWGLPSKLSAPCAPAFRLRLTSELGRLSAPIIFWNTVAAVMASSSASIPIGNWGL